MDCFDTWTKSLSQGFKVFDELRVQESQHHRDLYYQSEKTRLWNRR